MPTTQLYSRRYDYEGAATLLGIAPMTLKRWVSDGKIGYLKIGKRVFFTEDHLSAYLAQSEHQPREVAR